MSKPIVVIYFPDTFEPSGKRNWVYDYMAFLNGEEVPNNKFNWGKHDYSDYHWFCFYKGGINEPQLQVFYEKDFEQTTYEELKKLIQDSIAKQTFIQ